jgi:hypothetical protein
MVNWGLIAASFKLQPSILDTFKRYRDVRIPTMTGFRLVPGRFQSPVSNGNEDSKTHPTH